MTLARNLLQRLSGNKLFIVSVFICLWSITLVSAADKHLKIALLLPLNFQSIDEASLIDQKSFEFSNLGIDYYRGFKMAVDSLSKEGYTFDIKLFDTQSDTNQVKNFAIDPYLLTSDLIIGPVMPNEIEVLLKKNPLLKGKIISPISPLLVTKAKPSDLIMANNTLENHALNMAKYFSSKKLSTSILIVRNGLLAETRYSKTFEKYLDSADKKILRKELLTAQKGYGQIEENLSKTKENYLLIPSSDQAYAINLFKYLESLNNQYPITLLVHPKWLDFQTIDPDLFVKYKVCLSTSYFANYENLALKNFVALYRSTYATEPTEMSIRSIDQTLFFIKNVDIKKKSINKMDAPYYGLATVLNYNSKSTPNYNNQVFILKYDENGLSIQP
jgi:hypothetical protein